MDYMNQIIKRIEMNPVIKLGFHLDEYARIGTKADILGLSRIQGTWMVMIECHAEPCSIEYMTLQDYMEKTKDMK